jgi:hypothetical protein
MDVPGVGSGPTGPEFSSGLLGLAAPRGDGPASAVGHAQSGVAMDTILRELSELEFVRLLEFIERPPPPENAALLEELLRVSVSAAAEGNVQLALGKLAEFARLAPGRAESLDTEPGLASIHADVRQLLFRLASAAQLDAETRLGQATMLLQAADSKEIPGQEIRPEILILVAGPLSASRQLFQLHAFGGVVSDGDQPICLRNHSGPPRSRGCEEHRAPFHASRLRLAAFMDATNQKVVAAGSAAGAAIGVVCAGARGRFRFQVTAHLLAANMAGSAGGRRL